MGRGMARVLSGDAYNQQAGGSTEVNLERMDYL